MILGLHVSYLSRPDLLIGATWAGGRFHFNVANRKFSGPRGMWESYTTSAAQNGALLAVMTIAPGDANVLAVYQRETESAWLDHLGLTRDPHQQHQRLMDFVDWSAELGTHPNSHTQILGDRCESCGSEWPGGDCDSVSANWNSLYKSVFPSPAAGVP